MFEALYQPISRGGGLLGGAERGLEALEFLPKVDKLGLQFLNERDNTLSLGAGLLVIEGGFEKGGLISHVVFEYGKLRLHGSESWHVDFTLNPMWS